MAKWTFVSNYGLVLIYVSRHPKSTAREIAMAVDVTEWTVHKIISELESEGYLERKRQGRSNVYRINPHLKLRHRIARHVQVRDFLALMGIKEDRS